MPYFSTLSLTTGQSVHQCGSQSFTYSSSSTLFEWWLHVYARLLNGYFQEYYLVSRRWQLARNSNVQQSPKCRVLKIFFFFRITIKTKSANKFTVT